MHINVWGAGEKERAVYTSLWPNRILKSGSKTGRALRGQETVNDSAAKSRNNRKLLQLSGAEKREETWAHSMNKI